MSAPNWTKLIENTSHWDKDERYMATNDLCNLLAKDVRIEEHIEQKVCAAVLKQLDDASNDVQSVAVKCLGVLLKKVHEAQIAEISKKLSSLVVDSSKDALRDIYSIGLKTLISDVPASLGPLIASALSAKLLGGVRQTTSDEIKRESLDNLSDLLKRFGQHTEASHGETMSVLVAQLKHEKQVVRKRAAQALGNLVVVSSDALLNDLVRVLLTRIDELEKTPHNAQAQQESRTLIQTIGTIARTVGFRLGKHLPQIIPLFIRFCGSPDDEETHNDTANELRESCFPGLESFVLRCPKESAPFVAEILRVSLAFMKYDPNYSYEEDGDEMDVDEDEEQYDEEDYGGGSEDDDTSWKVRKAAVKVIHAVASAHPLLLRETLALCADDLVSRFKEREENVRVDIIACFAKCVDVAQESLSNTTVCELFAPRVDAIVSAGCVQLGGPSVKTKEVVVAMLKSLVCALKGGLGRHLAKLTTALDKLLVDSKNQSLRLPVLVLVRTLLQQHATSSSPASLLSVVERLLPNVCKAASEDWHKSVAEALRVLAAMVVVVRPYQNQRYSDEVNYQPLVAPIFAAVQKRLSLLDIDVEIKESAIHAASVVLCHFGASLSVDQRTQVLQTLQQRVENETTRTATLRAISLIATQCECVDLSQWTAQAVPSLALFTRHSSRTLRQLTLHTLNALLSHASVTLSAADTRVIVQEVSALLSTEDVLLLNHSLSLLRALLREKEKTATETVEAIHTLAYPALIALTRRAVTSTQAASQTQTQTAGAASGSVLQNLFSLLQALLATQSSQFSFASLFHDLYTDSLTALAQAQTQSVNKAGLTTLAKCVASLLSQQTNATVCEAVQRFAKDTHTFAAAATALHTGTQPTGSASDKEKESLELRTQLALHCIGETGAQADLSSLSQTHTHTDADLQQCLLACFSHYCEDVKYASACALGHVAAGNLCSFLPLIVQSISSSSAALSSAESASREHYLLLIALRETILAVAEREKASFAPFVDSVLSTLLATNANAKTDESARNLVAECLGLLTVLDASRLLPVLERMLSDSSDKLSLRTATHALRAALSSRSLSAEVLLSLQEVLLRFLPLLREEELEVKRAALQLVNTAAHHHPTLVHAHIAQTVFPVLLETLAIKKERTVDLGPFKHKVDDNLPLRKLSLAMLGTVLEHMSDSFDADGVMAAAPLLLADHEDVKIAFIQMLPRIAAHNENAVAVKLDALVPLLEATLAKAGKDTEKGGRDVLQTVTKTTVQLQRIASLSALSRQWQGFVDAARKSPLTADIFAQLESESLETH